MSAIPRSPKIPLSPSSPPETGLKRRRESDGGTKRPPSPGPEYMSVATKSYVSSYHPQNMDETASRSSPRSPASSASYNNNNTSTQRTSQQYSTPASSTSGIPGLSMTEDPEQHRDKRQRTEPPQAGNGDAMEVDPSVLPTNHNRSMQVKKEEAAPSNVLKDVQNYDEITETLDQLQKDMGDPFLLCRSKVQPARPDPSQHLLGIYGLSPLLKDAIRNDPVTGEKINKLRKSYEGQIKIFALSGKNKPVSCQRVKEPVELEEPGPLRKAIGSEWRGLQSDGDWERNNAVPEIKIDEDFRQTLRKALQIQPGTVRNPTIWDEYLGHDKQRPVAPPPTMPAPQPKMQNGLVQPRPREVVDARRTRGKKRSYDDESFVGYGDGFSDVEDAGARDDEDDSGSRRKRRKASYAAS